MLLQMTEDDGDLFKAIQRPWERVAQPVEHVTFNHGVLGSSPSALTKQNQTLTHQGERPLLFPKILGAPRAHGSETLNTLVIGLMLGIIRFALLAVAVGLLAIVCRTFGKTRRNSQGRWRAGNDERSLISGEPGPSVRRSRSRRLSSSSFLAMILAAKI